MTARQVAVLARPPGPAVPGVDGERLRLALLEDTYEVVAGLALVQPVLALCPGEQPAAEAVTWPGTPVVRVPAARDAEEVAAVFAALAAGGAETAAVVAGDAPDLPPLLVGKLFRGLGGADVAVCPAAAGGLVAVACRLPVPAWWVGAGVGLDTDDALARLAAAAPRRRCLAVGPGWHRVRTAADLARLDPGLEGWEVTRALLAPQP